MRLLLERYATDGGESSLLSDAQLAKGFAPHLAQAVLVDALRRSPAPLQELLELLHARLASFPNVREQLLPSLLRACLPAAHHPPVQHALGAILAGAADDDEPRVALDWPTARLPALDQELSNTLASMPPLALAVPPRLHRAPGVASLLARQCQLREARQLKEADELRALHRRGGAGWVGVERAALARTVELLGTTLAADADADAAERGCRARCSTRRVGGC